MAQSSPTNPPKRTYILTKDIYGMAVRLIAAHGSDAPEFAKFKALEKRHMGDSVRSHAWQAVHSTVTDMLKRRLKMTGLTIH